VELSHRFWAKKVSILTDFFRPKSVTLFHQNLFFLIKDVSKMQVNLVVEICQMLRYYLLLIMTHQLHGIVYNCQVMAKICIFGLDSTVCKDDKIFKSGLFILAGTHHLRFLFHNTPVFCLRISTGRIKT
jgi:hypothetical protein